MRRLLRLAVLISGLWLGTALPAAAATFSNWAAVVVAGDWRAHAGGPSEAFDNARRDVSNALVRMGFDPSNLRQFSVRPERYNEAGLAKARLETLYDGLAEASETATGGCLVYVSSHGAPVGVRVDEQILTPAVLAVMLHHACGERPTVVVLSACFSGVFVPVLAAPNRMVLTAARGDRSSFGCGETDRYPYFDDCFLSSVGTAHDFPALGRAVQVCVAARERKEGMQPPSEPQLWIGPNLKRLLPQYGFAPADPPAARFEGLRP
jgi:hypothetical protein